MLAWTLIACALLLATGGGPDRTSITGLNYRLEGSGPDIVLIHGFHTDLREWDDVAAGLARSRRVLRYDVRGHGRSALPAPLPSSFADLLGLLDELKIERATIVGLSMGATVALDFAITHPDRVDRLVLISPGIPGIEVTASFEWMKPIAAAVRGGDTRRAAELWWESPILAGVRQLGPAAERYRKIVIDNTAIWSVPKPPPPLDPPAGTRLADVEAQVLVIAGDQDITGAMENARRVASLLPRARLHTIAGAGHMISMERPDEVIRLVLDVTSSSRSRIDFD
jgi:3-oxoadipate enol-lactonase